MLRALIYKLRFRKGLRKLKENLLNLETVIGEPLYTGRRDEQCPIIAHAPEKDSAGYKFLYFSHSCTLVYRGTNSNGYLKERFYCNLYDIKDTYWWNALTREEHDWCMDYIQGWIKKLETKKETCFWGA